jgi:hypothetical protein
VPPAVLLGFLAIFNVPIKPGIAIIFSISLGLAFDNTVYVLERLKNILKTRKSLTRLPMARVVAEEISPCLVSSVCLIVGFSIFLFSYFPVNKMFGTFMLISITAGLLGDLVWLPSLLQRYPWLLLGRQKNAKILGHHSRIMESAMKVTSTAILVLLGLVSLAARVDFTPEEILKQVGIRSSPPEERVQLQMLTQERDGTKKVRLISILRKNGKEQKALVRLEQPADLAGVALLSVNSEAKEDQWLYLPSAKKTRRILGSNKKGKFLDSEIAYEDLQTSTYKSFISKIIKKSDNLVEVESIAKPNSESAYSKVHSWVSLPDYKLTKIEYYNDAGKLFKRTEFKDYQKIGGKYWRAKVMEVQNLETKRKTSLELKKLSLDKISDEELSLSALEE